MTQTSLIAQPHPFNSFERIDREFPPGLTPGEVLDDIDWPLRLDQFTHITVDGVEILRPEWDTRTLVAGEQMMVTVLPQGGDGNAKQIIGLIAIIAIALVAPTAGAFIAGFSEGVIGVHAAQIGFSLVASLAVGALLRPPGLALGSSSAAGEATPQYSMQGQANIATPYGPVPRVYGRQRVKPRIAAEPYTVNLYGDNFLFVIYDFGYGPLQIEDVRIGETPVTDFQGASYHIHETFVAGTPLQLYLNDTHSESLQADISDTTHVPVTRTTPAGAGALVIEVVAPQGQFFQQPTGEASGSANQFVLSIDGVPTPPQSGFTNRENTAAYGEGTFSVIHGGFSASTHRNPFSASFFYPIPIDGAEHSIMIAPGFGGNPNPAHIYTMILVGIRTYRGAPPIAPEVGHTIVELRVRASGQLSGMIESFSALATSKLRAWGAGGWTEPFPTRNPAWIYLDILTGSANNRPVPDDRIDLFAINAWGTECDTPPPNDPGGNFTCDITFDAQTTVRDALQMVAAAGRAAPAMRDLKVSVIRESAVPTPVQLITPRNSWNLNASMTYIDPPHALKIQYLSEISWDKEELIVYAGWHDGSTATKFESLDLPGTCRAPQAWRFGRYYLAAGMLRRERGSVSMDVENLIAQRGDMVLIAQDVMEVGGPAARVLTINYGLGTLALDSDLVTANVSGLRVRRADGWIAAPMAAEAIGVNVLRVSPGDAAQIAPGDLVVYGVIDRITGEYLVESIEPGADLTATVRFIEHRPEILQADTGPIPPRTPKPGTAADGSLLPVTGLAITKTTIIAGGQALYEFRLSWIPSLLAARYVVLVYEGAGWVQVGETAEPAFVDVKGWQHVIAGDRTYGVVPLGRIGASGAIAVVAVSVNPATDKWPPPPAPGDVKATVQPRGVLVTWVRPMYDFALGFMLRIGASPPVFVASDNSLLPPQLVGTYALTVATIDRTGTESAPVEVSFTIIAPSKVRLTGQAIVNNAILRWSDPSPRPGIWAGQTSHAIEHYEVTKQVPDTLLAARASKKRRLPREFAGIQTLRLVGRSFAAPKIGEVIVVGNVAIEYLVLEEQSTGVWRYEVRPVDVAGNVGPWASIDLTLTAPDNYFVLDADDNIIPESTLTNFYPAPNTWLAPFDMSITYQAHFTQGAWTTPQEIIDDGMPYWAQPPAETSLLEWEHDYVGEIPSVLLTVTPFHDPLVGEVDVALRYYTAVLPGDAWIDRGDPLPGTMIPSGQRLIRITMEVTPGADSKSLSLFDRVEYKLHVEYFTESGEVLLDSSGTAVITMARDFTDVRTVHLTSGDADIENLWYQVATDQQSVQIWATDTTGAPESGLVSWSIRGF